MSLPYSQFPTAEILPKPFIEEDDLNPTQSATAEDHTIYFVF